MTMEIEFGQGRNPPVKGSYIVYVNPEDPAFKFAEKMLLLWDGAQWYYMFSDQRYRDTIYGWVGPLPAIELED